MPSKTIEINRAPVLTLWAAVVAERLGFRWGEALSLGKGVAGLTAQSKGRRLGIFHPSEKKEIREKKAGETFHVQLLGRSIPCRNTDDGVRSLNKDRVVTSESVEKYLTGKFGDDLERVRTAMRTLAKAHKPGELNDAGFGLYEQFRPETPGGQRGWGAKGELKLSLIEKLAKR